MNGSRGVYLTGLSKSGKTPLRRLLGGLPWIRLGRYGWWEAVHGRVPDMGSEMGLAACLQAIARSGIAFDREAVLRDLRTGPPRLRTYAGIFGLVAASLAREAGARHWGDQASEIEVHAAEALDAFPDAIVIHLVRDPRDGFAGSATASRPGGVGPAVEAWRRSVALAERNRARYPEAYRIVLYEDLVADPEKVIADIACRFDERMTSIDRSLVPGSDSVGRYRRELTAAAITYIESAAAEEMERLGYTPSGIRPTGLDTIRYGLAGRPMAALRARLWLRRQSESPAMTDPSGPSPPTARTADTRPPR